MSQPPQDPHGYPWGPPEPSGASPQQSAPQQAAPQEPVPQEPGRAADPYGGGQYGGGQYGGGQYGTTPYTGAAYTGTSPAVAGTPGHAPTSTIVLLVLGGLLLLLTFWTVLGLGFVAPVVLAIVALVRRQDAAGGRRLTRIGWIVLAVVAVLLAVAVAVVVGVIASHQGSAGGSGGVSALGALAGVPV